jgi:hypothetical protein
MLVLERPFTVIIDTFLLPVVLCLTVWRLSPRQRRPLVWGLHLAILLNVILGYYEYFSGHRLIPLALGDVIVLGEWRASALFGHPLTAAGLVGGYVLALILRPALCPPALLRLPLIAFCLGSLMAFGGRTALVTVLLVIGGFAALEILRILRGKRTSLPMAIGAICLLFAAAAGIFAALDLGMFDKMLLRFSSDKGSAHTRYATFDLLSHFDWRELVLGPNPARASALQTQFGHRGFLGREHRPVWPCSYHPVDNRTGRPVRGDPSPGKRRRMGDRPAGFRCRRELGQLFIEEHPARAIHSSHHAVVAARAAHHCADRTWYSRPASAADGRCLRSG